uniref:Uncharacterized protein n=1 Tax=Arundo donax TaxID=35708 RepID=A0A0A9EQ92_ARUDO
MLAPFTKASRSSSIAKIGESVLHQSMINRCP